MVKCKNDDAIFQIFVCPKLRRKVEQVSLSFLHFCRTNLICSLAYTSNAYMLMRYRGDIRKVVCLIGAICVSPNYSRISYTRARSHAHGHKSVNPSVFRHSDFRNNSTNVPTNCT